MPTGVEAKAKKSPAPALKVAAVPVAPLNHTPEPEAPNASVPVNVERSPFMKVWTPPPPEKLTTPEPVKLPENTVAELLVGTMVLVVETAAMRLLAKVTLLTSTPPASVTGPSRSTRRCPR